MPSANSNGRRRATSESHGDANGSTNGNVHANGATDPAHNGDTPAGSGLGNLINEAEALRDYLRDGCVRASRLCVSLRRHRKQSKTVTSMLTSLRQLQQIG